MEWRAPRPGEAVTVEIGEADRAAVIDSARRRMESLTAYELAGTFTDDDVARLKAYLEADALAYGRRHPAPIGSQVPSRRKWDAMPFPDTQIDPHAPIHARRPSRGRRLLALLLAGAVIGLCYALSRN